MRYLFLIFPLIFGCSHGNDAHENAHMTRFSDISHQASTIKIGMTRSEVEKMFTQKDGGLQGPTMSRYYVDPEVKIEVPFDRTGGNWGSQNRVNGLVRVYRQHQILD